MKLKLKLPLAFGCLLALLLAAALFGIRMLHGSLVTFDTVVQRHMANERAVNQLDSGFRTQVQEWKNTLLRGREPELLARYWDAFQKEERAVADGASRLRDALPAGEARTLVASFAEAHARMGEGYRRGHAAFVAAGFDPVAGDRAVRGMDREPAKLLDEAGRRIAAESAATAQQASRDGRAAIWLSLGVMLAVSALGIGVSVAVSRMIVRPIDRAVRVAQAVAGGDLTAEVSSQGQDETAQLLNALGVMQAQLTQLVRHVRASAEGVASASSEIAQGNNDLSARTEQQAAALQQTAASMEELGAAVRLNADSSQAANQLAQDASAIAEQGGRVVGDVVETMRGIQGSSQRIAEITSVIDGIAFQTNILALNASVEAARAGEQGLGFAVVAGEVRQLAQRSAEAAREIKTLIGSSAERVERGTVLVDQAGSTMSGVVDAIRRVSAVVGEISTATREQSSGVSQIGQAVAQMDQATQRNAALVEECAAAAEGLRQRAAQLVQAVAVFRLPQGTG